MLGLLKFTCAILHSKNVIVGTQHYIPGNFDDPSGLIGIVALEDKGEPVAGVDRPLPVGVAVDDSRARKIFATCKKKLR